MNNEQRMSFIRWLITSGYLKHEHGQAAMKISAATAQDLIRGLVQHSALMASPQEVWDAWMAHCQSQPIPKTEVDRDSKTIKDSRIHAPKATMSQDEAVSVVVQTIKGRYEILRELGRGAMGVVYHARDKRLDREVAIKVVQSPTGQLSHEEVQELLDEAKTMAQFTHPNVVGVMDIGAEHGIPYIVMEFVKGTDLKGACEKIFSQLSNSLRTGISHQAMGEQVLDLFLPYIEGVAEIHQMGRVHRDLKPENGMVDSKGVAKVMDFGLAVRANVPAATAGGSPIWMSPEQVDQSQALGTEGEIPLVVSCGADVYTIGRMLYWGLTGGEFIHKGQGIASLFLDIMGNPDGGDRVRKGLLELGYDTKLISIVARCVAEKPQDRYSSAQELLEDLQEREAAIASEARMRIVRKIGLVAGVLVLLAMAFGLWSLYQASIESDRATQAALQANDALKREAETADVLAQEQATSLAAANQRSRFGEESALGRSHQQHYRWQASIEAYTRALDVYRESPAQHARLVGPILMERAHCYFYLRDPRSIADMDQAAQYLSEPLRSEAVFWSVLFTRVLPGGADLDYTDRLSRIRNERLLRLVQVYLSDVGDVANALSSLDQIPVTDRDWIWWFIRGLVHDRSPAAGQKLLARDAYTRAIELEPDFGLSYYNRAKLLGRLASAHYQAASREPAGSLRRQLVVARQQQALSDWRRLRLLMPGWVIADLNYAEMVVALVHFGEPDNSRQLIEEALLLSRSVWLKSDQELGANRFAAGLRMLQVLTVYRGILLQAGESVLPLTQEAQQVWERLSQVPFTQRQQGLVQQFREVFELR